MAYRNKKICNSKTGQDIIFLQTSADTNGELLEMESIYNEQSREPVPHYHPYQAEDFTVLEGELSVRMDGSVKVLKKGDTLHIPVNTVHSMWNKSNHKTIVNWKVRPAMNTEYLLETATGLANDGKTNRGGRPNMLQAALMMNTYSRVFRLAKPHYIVQKIVFAILAPIAFLSGYKATYKEYLD